MAVQIDISIEFRRELQSHVSPICICRLSEIGLRKQDLRFSQARGILAIRRY
jgi:hypothetical protein